MFPRWAFDLSRLPDFSGSLRTGTQKRSVGACLDLGEEVRGLIINIDGLRRPAFAACAALLASAGMALAMGASADVALAKAPPGVCGVPGQATENVFTHVTPLVGSTVHPGDLVGADFHDETDLNTKAPNQLQFTLTGPAGATTLNPTITNMPPYTGGKTGEYKIVKRISATLPPNPAPGSYTASIKGWDTDQTKPGADCGIASWTFQVQPVPKGSLSGDILLCASRAPVSGGTISASGPQSKTAAATPVSYPQVTPGSYAMWAGAPQGYHFVPCNASATIVSANTATLTVSVPANGSGNANFFVDANNVVVNSATKPRVAVKAAAVTFMPFTGRGDLLAGAVVGLVLVLLGMTMLLALARSTKRA